MATFLAFEGDTLIKITSIYGVKIKKVKMSLIMYFKIGNFT